jgi:hypothetical protein
MIPRLPWKLIGAGVGALAVALIVWRAIDSYGERRELDGRAAVQQLWDDDRLAWEAVNAQQVADNQAREAAAMENNARVIRDANDQLAAIAADRDGLVGLLHQARDQVRRHAAAQATGQRGIDALTGIAARAAEVDRRLADYDSACRRDAVRFSALQDEIRGQISVPVSVR